MTSFAIKGWLLGAGRISGTFIRLFSHYPGCTVSAILNGKAQDCDTVHLMKWFRILTAMELNPFSILQIRIEGEGEKELSSQMISYLLQLNLADGNMFMIILPNKALESALAEHPSLLKNDDYLQYCQTDFFDSD